MCLIIFFSVSTIFTRLESSMSSCSFCSSFCCCKPRCCQVYLGFGTLFNRKWQLPLFCDCWVAIYHSWTENDLTRSFWRVRGEKSCSTCFMAYMKTVWRNVLIWSFGWMLSNIDFYFCLVGYWLTGRNQKLYYGGKQFNDRKHWIKLSNWRGSC